jgi:hypothetical protein
MISPRKFSIPAAVTAPVEMALASEKKFSVGYPSAVVAILQVRVIIVP